MSAIADLSVIDRSIMSWIIKLVFFYPCLQYVRIHAEPNRAPSQLALQVLDWI